MTMTETTHEPRSQTAARRARGLIAELRLRQDTLALSMGMSQPHFSRKVNGRTPFTVDELSVLALEIGVSEEYLYGFTDDRGRDDDLAAGPSRRTTPR